MLEQLAALLVQYQLPIASGLATGLIYLANQLAFFRALGNWTKRTATAIAAGLVLLGVRALGGEADASLLELVVTFLGGGAVAAAPVAIAYKLARLGGNGPTQPQAKPGHPMPKVAGLAAVLLLALPSPLAAQGVTYTSEGGTRYTVVDASDSVRSWHVDLKEALERAANFSFANGNRDFWVLPAFRMRVSTTPGAVRVDTVWVTVPDSSSPPPVDTVTPPPVDTVTPPPVDTTPPVVVPPPTASARLLVTPERLATWQGMIASGHHLAQLADANCKGNRYGDTGLWCAWWYMATGDQAAGRKATTTWIASIGSVTDLNNIRENFIERAVTYDWLCGTSVATSSECATMRQLLDRWKATCQNIRPEDGDQTIGCYFGRVAYAFATGDQSDIAAAGGLDVTGANRSTQRNTVGGYLTHMDGGALGESYDYDMGTSLLALMGVEVVKSATGVDHFPEFPASDLARYLAYGYTPDLRSPVQWWDSQDPRDVTGRLFRRMTLFGSVAGVTKDPVLMRTVSDLFAKYGRTGFGSAEPWARSLIFYDPAVPVGPLAQGTWLANGMGMLYRRTATDLGWLAAFSKTNEDHEYNQLFDVQVYRNGGWALRNRLGYAGAAARVLASNGLSLAGFGSMYQRGMTCADSGVGWVALCGETSGSAHRPGYYDPPPDFVRYAGRTAVDADVGATHVVITRDTVDMDDPRTLPKFTRHPAVNQAWVQDADGKPWTIWHQPVQPTVAGNVVTWTAENGEPMRLEFFADQPVQTATYDESGLGWFGQGVGVNPSEFGWHTRSYTPARVLWSVVQVGPALPVSRSGDTVTVGGQSWTITTAGVVAR
ncbi:MAG: hypothetical protein AB7N73_14510 [Gemmatimonadales bacterium]